MLKKVLLCIIAGWSLYAAPKVVIWDFGGVLFNVSRQHIFLHRLGVPSVFSYMALDWKSPKGLQDLMFHALNQIEIADKNEFTGAHSPSGAPLPNVFCAWLAGKISGSEVIDRVRPVLDDLLEKKYFVSHREKQLVYSALEATFDPVFFCEAVHVSHEGIKLIKELKQCNPGIRLIALSNWDPWSFEQMKIRFKDELSLFDEIIISGILGVTKPDKRAFVFLLENNRLMPGDCIFIDDQKENTEAAEALGIPSIQFTNFNELRSTFFKLAMVAEGPQSFTRKLIGLSLVAAGIFAYHKGYFSAADSQP
jgi:FMN phosphatase YigB (HAD superfamily)